MGTEKMRKASQASSSFVLLLCALGLGLVLVGCSGSDGDVGPAGATGAAGAVGAAGPAGADGSAGARGPAGSAGAAGPAGPAGAAGTDGTDGAAGASAVVPGSSLAQGKAIKGVLSGSSVILSVYAANQVGAIGGPGAAGFSAPTAFAAAAVACGPGTTLVALSANAGVPAGALARCRIGSVGTTDANGAFALTVPDAQTSLKGPLHVEVTNGTMVDEATGASILGPAGNGINTRLRALSAVEFLDDLRGAGGVPDIQQVAVTALTEFATTLAIDAAGSAPTSSQAHQANTLTGSIFGIGADVVRTLPSDTLNSDSSSDSDASKLYGIVNAGFSQLAQDLGGDRDVLDLVRVGAEDYRNRMLDSFGVAALIPARLIDIPRAGLGPAGGSGLLIPGPAGTELPSDAFARQLSNSIATMQAGGANQTGFTLDAETLATISRADFSSNILVTLASNGIRFADAFLPSGSLAHVRGNGVLALNDGLGISGGVATMRNAVGNGAAFGGGPAGSLQVGSGGSFFTGETVFARFTPTNYVVGGARDDRGYGTITVSPRWTLSGVTANDVALGLAPAGVLAGTYAEAFAGGADSPFQQRTLTVTLSALTLNVTPTGVIPVIPADAVLHVSGVRDANGNPLQISTPLPTGGVISRGFALQPNNIDFLPNGLIRAISAAGFSQFDGLGKSGTFTMKLAPGLPILLHTAQAGAGTQAESNAPPATGTTTCKGSSATVTANAPLLAGACVFVDEMRLSLTVKP